MAFLKCGSLPAVICRSATPVTTNLLSLPTSLSPLMTHSKMPGQAIPSSPAKVGAYSLAFTSNGDGHNKYFGSLGKMVSGKFLRRNFRI